MAVRRIFKRMALCIGSAISHSTYLMRRNTSQLHPRLVGGFTISDDPLNASLTLKIRNCPVSKFEGNLCRIFLLWVGGDSSGNTVR